MGNSSSHSSTPRTCSERDFDLCRRIQKGDLDLLEEDPGYTGRIGWLASLGLACLTAPSPFYPRYLASLLKRIDPEDKKVQAEFLEQIPTLWLDQREISYFSWETGTVQIPEFTLDDLLRALETKNPLMTLRQPEDPSEAYGEARWEKTPVNEWKWDDYRQHNQYWTSRLIQYWRGKEIDPPMIHMKSSLLCQAQVVTPPPVPTQQAQVVPPPPTTYTAQAVPPPTAPWGQPHTTTWVKSSDDPHQLEIDSGSEADDEGEDQEDEDHDDSSGEWEQWPESEWKLPTPPPPSAPRLYPSLHPSLPSHSGRVDHPRVTRPAPLLGQTRPPFSRSQDGFAPPPFMLPRPYFDVSKK